MAMDTSALKKFAQEARRQLLEQVSARMEQVLQIDSVEIREKEKAVKELQEQISQSSKQSVIDQVAYTWFNRFCALRYMDVNHYTRLGIVSPMEGFTQPEILQEAKQGVIDGSFKVDKQRVYALLNGQLPSSNPQQEAYQLLLVGACNAYHAQMPFLFPKIEDYTELLMPEDLLSENSVLQEVKVAMTQETCQDIEVIGWLYQYYISERKDEVFASLKKRKKIEASDIPAATQLFTPHWIVRYLVENSLGRLWMLNHPNSRLIDQMKYYIQPEEPETDFLRVNSPEELKICDPACGSGHMLTYAFDLLYAIYEEQGYDPVQIPQLILEKNLYGIEIDQRAGHLAAFALTMKARKKDRRYFRRGVEPNICVLRNVSFTTSEIDEYIQVVGRDLFTQDLWLTLRQFERAENFGSLIRPALKDVMSVRKRLQEQGVFENLFLHNTNQKVDQVLKMAKYLSSHYHVVVANPPYMGVRNMDDNFTKYAKDQYPNTKYDLFAMFIERNMEIVLRNGLVGMITMQSWMFLSSFERMRQEFLTNESILSMAHLGARAFDSIGGEVVSTTAFITKHKVNPKQKGAYIRLVKGNNEAEKALLLQHSIPNTHFTQRDNFYVTSAANFKKIPSSPIAYWASDTMLEVFDKSISLENISKPLQGATTSDNKRFLRFWHEVGCAQIGFDMASRLAARKSNMKWFPYNKGGGFRRWYGNQEHIINYYNDGEEIKIFHEELSKTRPGGRLKNQKYYFQHALSWSKISSGSFAVRYFPKGFIFDVAGSSIFLDDKDLMVLGGLLNSKLVNHILGFLSPTINFEAEHVRKIPILPNILQHHIDIDTVVQELINISKIDWESFETSWGFCKLAILKQEHFNCILSTNYAKLRAYWQEMTLRMQALEKENNHFFINAYGVQNELIPDVPLSEITLTCNPHYRYGSNKSAEELEAFLLADTMKDFISYAVGCMFGRYSLDKPGLILASTGETVKDYFKQIPEPSFAPDEDNVIPLLKGEWFEDDIAERFKDFLKVTFGEENFEENLVFLEGAIGRNIRDYFVKYFYNEHLKMYKKRPIYWLFSSPNGSFNALIYMHRYRPDTISVILNDYLRQYRDKLTAHRVHQEAVRISDSANQRDKTRALKEVEMVNKVLAELKEYEDEILYPLATQQIEIDLDDGVKVNYNKFGKALKKVPGLSK